MAIGSVDEYGHVALDPLAPDADVAHARAETERLGALLRARGALYRQHRPGIAATGRVVIVVDDGLATGAAMAAALRAVRLQRPTWLVGATPVAAPDALADIRALADEFVYLAAPEPFGAVGRYYLDFADVDDARVMAALAPRAAAESNPARASR